MTNIILIILGNGLEGSIDVKSLLPAEVFEDNKIDLTKPYFWFSPVDGVRI